MHYFILYASFQQAIVNGSKATIDIAKVSCILCGIMLIVLGNYMTKSKKNAVIGLRTSWSIFNDNTWRKSNRFGAICIIIAGGLTVVTSAFANGIISTIFLLLYIIVASVLAVIYSKKVYDNERKKEQNQYFINCYVVFKLNPCNPYKQCKYKNNSLKHNIIHFFNEKYEN